ncbi:hypothetical protein Ddye_021404 [Dipteronia dyeriana]|uniref:Uncharacterized protein n=1 Tax=Dipteronia dyeriana TaxID=168575 RepID=A0AAD9U1J6_9ROSI|nr:hypothetical protein Ddye_021404 [Dipteronia dyeriana]
MFNFLCKTFLLRYGKSHTVRAGSSICKFQHFQSSILVKYVSTTTSRPESIIVSYLINSCGLSPESALAASKCVNSGSQKSPDLVISFFGRHGFSEAQISKVIRRNPRVLWTRPEETLLPKFEFLYSRGFSGPEIGYIFQVYPAFLHRSLENHIIPIFNYLDDLFKSSCETAVAAIKRSPVLLRHDVKTCLAPNVNVLRDNGVPESNIHLFLRYWSRMFGTRPDTFRNTVKVVKEMGINPLHSHFVQAVYVIGCGNAKWDSKVSVYKRWGWSEEEVLAAFVKYPMFMTASENKIMAVMDFLVNQMHLESSAIAKCPSVIVLSLENTFVPRAAVIQFLMSNGLIKKKQNANLFTVFKYPEKTFLQRFVNCYDEAPQLLKLYQEKLELSKTKKK